VKEKEEKEVIGDSPVYIFGYAAGEWRG